MEINIDDLIIQLMFINNFIWLMAVWMAYICAIPKRDAKGWFVR